MDSATEAAAVRHAPPSPATRSTSSRPNRSSVETRSSPIDSHACGARAPGRASGTYEPPTPAAEAGSDEPSSTITADRTTGAQVLEESVGGAAAIAGHHRHRDVAPTHRPALGFVAVHEGVRGETTHRPGQLPAEVVRVGDRGVHAATTTRRHPVRSIADEDDSALAQPARHLGREGERVGGQDLDVEVGPPGGLADHRDAPLRREGRGHGGRIHARWERDREDEPAIDPARHEDRGRASVAADHVQPVDGVGQDLGQVGAEQDAQVLAQVVRSFHRDPERVTHGGTMPVRADQVAAADGRDLATDPVAEPSRHAIRIPLERDQLGREPDLAHAERPKVVDEDRFEVVLRAHGGGRRAHRRGHLRHPGSRGHPRQVRGRPAIGPSPGEARCPSRRDAPHRRCRRCGRSPSIGC